MRVLGAGQQGPANSCRAGYAGTQVGLVPTRAVNPHSFFTDPDPAAFNMNIRIPALKKICNKLPYEEFSGVKNKRLLKGKNKPGVGPNLRIFKVKIAITTVPNTYHANFLSCIFSVLPQGFLSGSRRENDADPDPQPWY